MTVLRFFLGGADLEMAEIRALLEIHAPGRFVDKGLEWGAKASDCRDEIAAALARGETPVLVELDWDLDGIVDRGRVREIDHHGDRAGRPASLRQAFEILGLPEDAWTRRLELVAANDVGHIRAMKAAGATAEEIAEIRRADRAAQGVGADEEADAAQAIARGRELTGASGTGVTVIAVSHDRSTAAADLMEADAGGPGFENLVVVMPSKLAFFGSGALVLALKDAAPESWWGGALPERGFWGRDAAGPVRGPALASMAVVLGLSPDDLAPAEPDSR